MSDEILLTTFTRLKQRLKYMAGRFLSDHDDVEDQLQETFCRLWLRKEEIDTSAEAEAMIVTTVRHLCIDVLRKQESIRQYEQEAAADLTTLVGIEDTERLYDSREKLRVVEQLIAQSLTPLQQKIIRLKEYEGKSQIEIAHLLGMQPEAVRMQLSRARKTIRTCYQNINNR